MTHFFYSASIYVKEYIRGIVTDKEMEETLSILNFEAQEKERKRLEGLKKREKEKREAG